MKKLLTMMVAAFFGCPLYATTWYVNGTSGSDSYSGKSSAAAKKTIQAAVDAAAEGDTILVAAGNYSPIQTNNKRISIVGSERPVIDGKGMSRCAYLGDDLDQTNTVVSGFVLRCGYVDRGLGAGVRGGTVVNSEIVGCTNTFYVLNTEGGGAFGTHLVRCYIHHNKATHGGGLSNAIAENCVISDNVADDDGGGVITSVIINCLVTDNQAFDWGGVSTGGACQNCSVTNCTIVGNYASSGGVIANSKLYNSIIYGNSVGRGDEVVDDYGETKFVSCCRSNPDFVDLQSGDYHLTANSPCVDAGENRYACGESDLDGGARIVNGRVDIGCYEYRTGISLNNGLIAWYKFDGNANDSSGKGNNGVVQGATLTADRFGNPNGAYAFDGVDDSIRVPSSVSLETAITKFCVSVWMKADWDYYDVIPILHKDQQLACVLQKAHSGMSGQPEESDFFVGAGWFEDDFEFGCKVPVDGFWHHWAFVGDGINIKVYLDGSYKGSGSVGLVDKSDSDLYVGVVNLEGYLNGTLDDLRIYNRALSAAEVKALYEGEGGSSAGGVQLWENGPYWAECNVGASGAEGEGWSFLFGDTRAHRRVGDTGDEWEETGSVVSAGATDPAEAYWGEGWRCPTGDEYRRLFTDCDYHWEVVRGVTGWRLQGRGSFRDNSIFIPLPPEDPMEDDWLRDYRTDGGDVAQILCEGAKCWSDDSRRIGPCLVHWWGFEGNPALLRAVRDTPLNPPSPVPTMYIVTLDAAGGTAEWAKGEVVKGAAVGTLPTATREGYEFLGWFTAAVGGTQVTAATVVTEDVTFYAQWRKIDETPIATYGPWGEAEAVKNPDKLGPTMLTDMTLELNGAAGAVGDVVAAFRGDTGALCGLGKVMDESGTLSMVCYAPTGVKLHFKVWVAASGVEEPVVVDCDAKSDLTAPTSGTFLPGHALVVSDDKDLTISLGSADWHTVSFNVLPEDPSPAAVFGSVKAKIAAVTQGIEFWMPGKSSSLKAIEIGKGYWVNTKVDDVVWTVSGKTDPKTEIALEEGWNLVGYAPEAEGAVHAVLKTALAAKAVDYVTYGVEFYPGGTLKKMEPGKAYWVHAKKAWKLVYDEVGTTVKAARLLAGAAAGDGGSTGLGAATPTYGPWGESEAVKNPDKLGPTFLTDMAVEIDGEPAEEGDVVAVFRGDTGALCGLGKVMDDSGTLTVVCYAPKGVTLSFKVWLSESGVEEAVVVKCDNASKLVAPESGAFYAGHAISGSTSELIETIVPGEKVTIDAGLVGYTASGLPKGLSYSKTTGKITGSASKPTAAEGVVVKFTKNGAETEELTIVVTAIPKVTVVMEGVNSPSDTDGCKVTGAGAYLVGKKVTLKATAPKGTVFMGWAAAGDGGSTEEIVSKNATYAFTMGKEDVALVAKFKKEVMSVGCEALSSEEPLPAGVLCAEGGIELDISTESGVKSVKVDKLPAGMKYDAKTELITGAPTKAGDNKVVITVTARSGAVAKKEIEVKVAAMPVMAVGTFTGFVSVGEDNFGTFTLTTTDAGKLTAKVVTAAGTVTFSGTCWDAVEEGVYRATLTTKKGEKLTLTLDSTAAWDAQQLVGNYSSANGRTLGVTAQRNAFGKTWYFAADGDEATGWTFAYAATAKAAALTVTLKADGSTAIAGTLPNGTDAKGKAVTIKVSASGYANVGMMREGAMAADFAPVLTVNKEKKVLAIRTNLWFDRKNDHESDVGEARFVK